MISFFWLLISYLLGSFPSGYLISRWAGKDILKIGWRKTSGSNVFQNVGKWQGVLTGILDLLKGYLAVFGAQKLGLASEVQILSGVAVITGHNWSVFLRFAGGRGIGTFIGAFLAISPQVLSVSLIPFALIALIWDASIGTLFCLATAILVSLHFQKFETAGLFAIISLAPILIKRLSPIEEITQSKNKLLLIKNRLIFDRDEPCPEWRIIRIMRKILKRKNSGNSNKTSFFTTAKKIFLFSRLLLTTPLLLPPKAAKYSLKAAKMGIKLAKKPIGKIILKKPETVVLEIKVDDLKKMLIASAKKIVFHQEEINKINVFPVADKDTGYNLAATLLGIEGVISQKNYKSIFELSQDIKEGALMNAKGNAGMIFTGYLIRFLDEIKSSESIGGRLLAKAMTEGSRAAYFAILNPVEGTILDTMRAAGEGADEQTRVKKERNIIRILEKALEFSKIALKETKEKLEVLKQNDVVDAGGLGFVKILEAWLESLKGLMPAPEPTTPLIESKEIFGEPLKYRYCCQFSFQKTETDLNQVRERIKKLGESIEVVESDQIVKVHFHSNQPEILQKEFQNLPGIQWYVEDILLQIRGTKKKPLGLVVGETADLPKEFLEKYEIEEVPFQTKFPDGEILGRENLYSQIAKALKTGRPLPTTSAPPFGDFLSAYRRALNKFENILVITLSSKLSGTYSSAQIARSLFQDKKRVRVFDCFTAEVGEGLVAIKAQELISQGKNLEEILEILKAYCPKVRFTAVIADFKYVARSGRVKLPHFAFRLIFLAQKAGIQPLLEITNGKVKFSGIRFGKDVVRILTKEIDSKRSGQKIKVAIAQANCPKLAQELKKELEKKEGIKVLFISQVSPVVGVYAGPGTLIIGFAPL